MDNSTELAKARALLAELRELWLKLPSGHRMAVRRALWEAADRAQWDWDCWEDGIGT